MKDFPILGGAGGALGGGSRAPQNKPDNLFSDDFVEFVLGLCEGPIGGLARGPRSFYADGTPLVSADGQNNFDPFQLHVYHGDLLATDVRQALGGTTSNTNVGVSLAYNTPVVRTTDQSLRNLIDQLEIRINIQALSSTASNGDTGNHTTEFQIEYRQVGETEWVPIYDDGPVSLTGKTSSGYVREFVIDVPRTATDWEIRVTKLTQDNLSNVVDALAWESFQAVTKDPRNYPNLALVRGYARASNQFQSIPNWEGVYHAKIIKVPDNYDVVTRHYDGVWGGTFIEAVSDNPAWVLYDVLTNASYGFRKYFPDLQVDRFSFYEAAKWCDELVPRPGGGYQPRWTYNEALDSRRNALELVYYLAGVFGGIPLSNFNGQVRLKVDRPGLPVQIFGPESVTSEGFSYQFTDIGQRVNDVTVNFINPNLGWEPDVRRVTADQAILDANGNIPSTIEAVGCIDVYEAQRRAYKRVIQANTEKVTVNFSTARAGMQLETFDLVGIVDPDMNWGISGRVKSVAGSTISLRDQIFVPANTDLQFEVVTPGGPVALTVQSTTEATRELQIVSGTYPATAPEVAQFALTHADLGLVKPFRILSIEEDSTTPGVIRITALEQNVNKYGDIDNMVSSGTVDYASNLTQRPPAPTGLVLESGDAQILTTADGNRINRLHLNWDPDPGSFIKKYQVRVQDLDADRTRIYETTGTDYYVEDVTPGHTYEASVVALSVSNRPSPPSQTVTHVVQGRSAAPAKPTGWTGTPGISTITLQGPPSSEVDFSHHLVEMFDATDTLVFSDTLDGTVYTRAVPEGDLVTYYKVRAVDRSGNTGAQSDPISVQPRPVATGDLDSSVTDAIDAAAQSAAADKTAAEEAAAIALDAKTLLVGLSRNSDFSLEYENWTNSAAGTGTVDGNVNFSVVTTGTEVGGKALEVMGYNALVTKGLIAIDRTRTYRVRIRLKNVSGSGVSLPRFLAGVVTFDESLTQETASPGANLWCVDSSYNYVPDDGEWHTYEGEITGEGATHNNFRATTKWARLFVGLNYGQSLSQKLQVDEFRIDDVTEIKEAAAFAEDSENSAITASGHASTALTQAGYATDAAAAAAVSQRIAARSFSAAIIDPTFLNWTGAAPANVTFYEGTGGGTLTKSADDTFGNAIVFTTPASPPASSLHPFIQLQSSNAGLKLLDSTDTLRIQIRATVEKLSGSLAGGWIRAIWYALGTGGASGIVDVPFNTQLVDANGVQVMEALCERPDTFVEGSSPGFVVIQIFATGYGGSSPAVSFKLHALQAEAVNALATSSIAQIAKTTLDGIASSAVALTTQAGATYASLRVASYNDLSNPYSKVEIEADYFVFRGGLAIFEDAALQSSDFVPGVSGWQISEDGNAEFNQLIVRNSIVPGAVSDDTRLVDVTEQASGHSVAVLTGNTGPIAIDDFYHFAFRCEYRAPNTSGGSTTISFRYKTLSSGVWSAYSNFQFSVPRGVSTWALVNGVTHFSGGPYDDIQFELVTEIGGSPTTVSQTNIRNAMILANALQR